MNRIVNAQRLVVLWFVFGPVAVMAQHSSPDSKQDLDGPEIIGNWNLTELRKVPEFSWMSRSGPIHSLTYRGESCQGHPTQVFAFYASPRTLGTNGEVGPFPAVVLIHGGGGTAFAEWVWLWAQRGYAAIAMDLSGRRPIDPIYDASGVPVPNQAVKPETRSKLTEGGPEQGHPEKFDSVGGEIDDDWPFHAAASVIRAHSLIRSFPEVNPEATAVTGISWGGYTTCLAASLDNRFRAAVPVYGCGFLHEGESVQKPAIDRLQDRKDLWVRLYDPSSLLPHCRVPILFVNGTNDVHYVLDSYQKSFDLVPARKQMRIEVKMPHSHPAGWAPKEIGLFIDSYCRNGEPLPALSEPVVVSDGVSAEFSSVRPVKAAALHFTCDSGLRSERNWQSLEARIQGNLIHGPPLPQEANTWFISVTDDRDAMVSTTVQFRK